MDFKNILKRLIVENQTSFEVLFDKFTKPTKDPKTGKPIKPLLNAEKFVQILIADPTTKVPDGFNQTDYSPENIKKIKPGKFRNWLLANYAKPLLQDDQGNIIDKDNPYYTQELKRKRELFMEDLFKVTDDLKKFEKYKQYYPEDKRDINKFTVDSLFDFTSTFQLPEKVKAKMEKTELKKEIRKTREGFNHPGGEIIFEGPNYTVIKIDKSKGKLANEAATWYGGFYDYENGESRWCTSPPNASYTSGYLKDGPLYVVFPNDDKGLVGKRTGLPQERYQFHFPSNQFMDRQDRGINLVESLNGKFKEFKDLFKSEFAKGLVSSSNEVNKINVQYPSNAAGKFIALYGFEEFFESIPDNIDSLIVENQSKEEIALDVPPSIGRFKNLKTLLFKNLIKSIPPDIKNCQRLNFLSLTDNKQLRSLPNEVGELPSLAFLALTNNNPEVEKNIPAGIRERFAEEQGGMWFLE
jgi:hypothetical protein